MPSRTDNHGSTAQAVAPVFLVLERDMLIAEDIVDSLRSDGPCRTIHVSDAADIAISLEQEPSITAAFLQMRYGQVLATGLHELLSLRGALIILTVGEDDETAARDRGWGMLIRPFTDLMIRGALPRRG